MSVDRSARAWADAAGAAATEMSEMFGLGAVERAGTETVTPPLPGSLISLVGDEVCIQIAVLAEPVAQVTLVRAMLCIAEGDGDPPHGDVKDAVCELVNVLGGALKTAMNAVEPNLCLGLPLYVGSIEQPTAAEAEVLPLLIGGARVHLLVVHELRARFRKVA